MTRSSAVLLASILAGCVSANSRSDYVRYQQLARELAAPLSTPQWTSAVQASNVALVAPVPGRGLLVGYTRMEKNGANIRARVPRTTRLVLHDTEAGRPIWEREVDLPGTDLSLLASEPALVVAGEGVLHAFDPATGATRWTGPRNGAATAVHPGRGLVVIRASGSAATATALSARSLADGTELWNVPLPGPAGTEDAAVVLVGDEVVTVGGSVAFHAVANGKLLRELRLGAPLEPPFHHVLVRGGVAVAGRGSVALVRLDGTVAWQRTLSGPVEALASDGSALLVAARSATGIGLQLLTLEGRERWTRSEEPLAGVPAFSGNVLVVPGRIRVAVLETATGKELGAAPRTAAMREGVLPDRVIAGAGQATIVGETGVIAIDLDKRPGAVRWHLDLRGVDGSTLAARRAQALRARLDFDPSLATTGWREAIDDERMREQVRQAFVPLSRVHDPWVARLEDRQVQMPGLTHAQRLQMANTHREIDRANARIQAAAASASLAASGAQMVFAARAYAVGMLAAAQAERSEAAVVRATTLWALAVQGERLVRPIEWEFGAGVLVADLRTGRWIEVVTEPAAPAVHDFYMRHPLAVLSTDSARLYTLAHADPPSSLEEFVGLTIPAQSAAAFALPDFASWAPPEEYPRRSRAPSPLWDLRRAP